MIPINLIGTSLGERHRHLNKLVQEAYKQNTDFCTLQDQPESSPLDRLFKIDLASKKHNVEYIIKSLKDSDMLYVSRALKSKWLLELTEIINPEYLEDHLYPEMLTTAVNKMKHWIYINLKNEERCRTFYQYYHENSISYAIKFIRNCGASFIKDQFPHIIKYISPNDLKILCEINPDIAKTYFNTLIITDELKSKYLKYEKEYFNVLINLIKIIPEFVLDTVENILNVDKMKSFSPSITTFIMRNQKERFMKKPELYTVYLLNMETLANCLNPEEIMNLIIKLARAKYLCEMKWFSYKKVEPLINKLSPRDKTKFKKKVFVDKDVGDNIDEWLYKLPSPPALTEPSPTIFDDEEHSPNEYEYYMDYRSILKKRKYCKWGQDKKPKTRLDMLFDEFRFASFDKTLYDLRKRISAESSAQNRQYMLLVLVSKSGGHEDNICKLLELLRNHRNEPCNLKATIIRSLVKRARIWRFSQDTWNQLIEFAHGLGLDGQTPEINCEEGVHAVVIRELLTKGQLQSELKFLFLELFSTLVQYDLSIKEKCIISKNLSALLFSEACKEENIFLAVSRINMLFEVLHAYKIPIETYPDLISKIESLANIDVKAMESILRQLFKAKIGRHKLFRVNFSIICSQDSYLNALRHDSGIISPVDLLEYIVTSKVQYKTFFSKISIYFNENGGLAKQFLEILKAEEFNVSLAKPLTLLLGPELENYIKSVDGLTFEKCRNFAASIRANVHLARPALDIDSHWLSVGVKAIANKVLICRDIDVKGYVQKLLENTRTMKLASTIAKRKNDRYIDALNVLGKHKPTKAIKSGLDYIKKHADYQVWNIIKPLIINSDLTKISKIHLKAKVDDVTSIPIEIRPEYSVAINKANKNASIANAVKYVCHVENFLPKIDEEFVEDLLLEYLKNFAPSEVDFENEDEYEFINNNRLYIRILVKFLLLSKSEEKQNKRLQLIGHVFLDKMEETWSKPELRSQLFLRFLEETFVALKYNKVYLNKEYVSCMPVMEAILSRMKKVLSIKKYFQWYVYLHLIILYYKSVQKNLDIVNLEELYNNKKQVELLTEKVVFNFGKTIASELEVLKTKYFESIEVLYINCVTSFFSKYFNNNIENNLFVNFLIDGVIDQNEGKHNVLGVYLLRTYYYSIQDDYRKDLVSKIKNSGNDDIKIQMLLYGELF